MMRFGFKHIPDGDIVETVKFTRDELRAIVYFAEAYWTAFGVGITNPSTIAVAARRLSKITEFSEPAWLKVFTENHD